MCYRIPSGAQTKRSGFRIKRDAQDCANDVEVKKLTGEFIAPAFRKSTVDELSADWLAGHKQSTAERVLAQK